MSARETQGDDGRISARRSVDGAAERRGRLKAARRARRLAGLRLAALWLLASALLLGAGASGAAAWRASRGVPPSSETPRARIPLVAEASIAPTGTGALAGPTGVAVSADRVYVADPSRAVIAVFSRGGSRLATIGAGELKTPISVAVRPSDGRVYVSDRGLRRVVAFDADGRAAGELRPQGSGASSLDAARPWDPLALAFAGDGTLYVADAAGDQRIAVFSAQGVRTGSIGAGVPIGRSGRRLAFPNGIAVTGGGMVVSDTGNGRVLVFGADGTLARVVRTGGTPRGAAALPDGRVVIADGASHTLLVLAAGGNRSGVAGRFGTARGEFAYPNGVAVDDAGRIFVADAGNARVGMVRLPPPVPARAAGPLGAWPWLAGTAGCAVASLALALRARRAGTGAQAEAKGPA